MIISASRRTDIPAFYSGWLMKRIREGFFFKVNPYNVNQVKGVSLHPEDVAALVFISKYPAPLLEHLEELDRRGYNYIFQYTLNDYDAALEPKVPPLDKRIQVFKEISSHVGRGRVTWRYDPIVYSNRTDVAYHLERFKKLAEVLGPYSTRVIISFLDFYPKMEKRMEQVEEKYGIIFQDIMECGEQLAELCHSLKDIALANNLEIQSCAEEDELVNEIIKPGSCIDPDQLNDLFGLKLKNGKDPYQREGCLCTTAEDMGSYDTCLFNCTYCYASKGAVAVKRRTARHNPESSTLLGDCNRQFHRQQPLFGKPGER
ncbi:MAG: DUF1848 domain-containing protein [Halanaerobium sp.]|nr:DUF1848 domain-containing protein [Halanaerobium sp.]